MLKKTLISVALLTSSLASSFAFADGPIQCMTQCSMNAASCSMNCMFSPNPVVCTAGCMDQLTQCMLGCLVSTNSSISGACSSTINGVNAEVKKMHDIQQLQNLLHTVPNTIAQVCVGSTK